MKKIMFNDHFGLTEAVLDGRKTMTRRTIPGITPEDSKYLETAFDWDFRESVIIDEYARFKPGEVVAVAQRYSDIMDESVRNNYIPKWSFADEHCDEAGWKNKMYVRADLMPHQIRITSVRIERLQEISNDDCLQEGIYKQEPRPGVPALHAFETCTDQYGATLAKRWYASPRDAFAALIDKVSGKGTWKSNPFVFVYEFEKVK